MGRSANLNPFAPIADYLTERKTEILIRYADRLSQSSGEPAPEPSVLDRDVQEAEQLLGEFRAALHGGRPADPVLVHDGDTGRVAPEAHLPDPFRAAVPLFEVILGAICEYAADRPDQAEASAAAAMAMYHNLMWLIGEAWRSYAGFLLKKIHETNLNERRRIAREIHDRVGHGVSAADRNLELYHVYVDKDPARAHDKVIAAHDALRKSIDSIRHVVSDLRLLVRVESLEKAILGYIEASEYDDTHTELVINGDESWIPPTVIDDLFLIIRGALHNAQTHGRARNITVKIDIAPHEVRASVLDDGTGFDLSAHGSDGAGLAAMRERVALLKGSIRIASRPGRGTSIDVIVSLPGIDDAR